MNTTIQTGIHTRVNSKYRISSIYRNWGIVEAPQLYGWETIVWVRQQTKDESERIAHSEATRGNAQNVVDRHAEISNKIIDNGGEWKDEEQDEE
jgi:hypothetical protein